MVAHQNLSITDPPTNLEPPPVTGIQRVVVIGLGISETFDRSKHHQRHQDH
jgi:hypothetical protein